MGHKRQLTQDKGRAAKNSKLLSKQQALTIAKRLNELYPHPRPPLDFSNEFTLLIAVLLSAQCTDVRVNQITPELFSLADSPKKMSQLSYEKILEIIKPCGLGPQKAKAITELSKILIDRFAGKVPNRFEDLCALPGVGRKTAQVVLAQAFDIPSFPVDTHIDRLAHRWRLTSGKSVLQTERDLKAIFPENLWNRLHLQIIFYGREYCTARRCKPESPKDLCELCKKWQTY